MCRCVGWVVVGVFVGVWVCVGVSVFVTVCVGVTGCVGVNDGLHVGVDLNHLVSRFLFIPADPNDNESGSIARNN